MVNAEYTVLINGQPSPLKMHFEVWTAELPVKVVNPFDPFGSGSYETTGPAVELNAKMELARRQLKGTPVRTITTISLAELMSTLGGGAGAAGGAGGMAGLAAMMGGNVSFDLVQTVQITSVVAGDVDAAKLEIPIGYTKR
jgi:hypothetical protein